MAFTHTVTQSISTGPGPGYSGNKAYTGDGKTSREVAVPDSSTDLLVNLAVDLSQLKSLFMLSDQDMTVETNSGAAPDDTISLKAGVPYIWNADAPQSNPFTVDVTKLYLTTGVVGASTLNIEVLQDATP